MSLSAADLDALEAAAFAAWPSAETLSRDGWRLRFDRGYTRRANSANASMSARDLSIDALRAIEADFQSRGLPTVFRLPEDAPVARTEALLDAQGYRRADPSLVMTLALEGPAPDARTTLTADAPTGLSTFQTVTGQSGRDAEAHLQLLRRIEAPHVFASRQVQDAPVCCGLGVLTGGFVGLFDIATHASHRGAGHGRALCEALADWGRSQGARTAFLQVAEVNTAARALYERMGYRVAYRYHYRIKA